MYRFLVYTFLDVVYLMVGMVVFSFTLKSQQDTLVALFVEKIHVKSTLLRAKLNSNGIQTEIGY